MLNAWPNIRTIRQGDVAGYGPAKNTLIEHSRGDYILLLDDDVALEDPRAVSELLAASRQLNDRCLLSLALEEDQRPRTVHYGLFFTPTKRAVAISELREMPPFRVAAPVGACVFARRRVLQELGGFDPIYPVNLDDYDLGARAGVQGIAAWVIPGIAAVHLGAARRERGTHWEWSYSYYLCGMTRTLVKTCRLRSAVFWIPGASAWILWRGLVHSRTHGLVSVARAFARSLFRAMADTPSTWTARLRIQSARTIPDDGFLRMLPPPGCRNLLGRSLASAFAQPALPSDTDPLLRPLPHN
jgi:GT2 family glycosyltransferase